ncbi:MAG TPA: DUF1833 family protein [Burkholderiaceae bacterium]|nr:DUF1833 family protein [Burkholderiaceae bacterium]
MATDALQEARASAPSGETIIQTLELRHPLWPAPYYLTNHPRPFDAELEDGATPTFMPFPFAVVLPSIDGAGQQDMQISITNADQTVADAVRAAHADPSTNIQAVYREFLGSDLGAPQSAPVRLVFDSIQITTEAVSGTANRSDVLNRRFPGVWYDVQHFPGLDR